MSLGNVIRPQTRLLIYRWSEISAAVRWHCRTDLREEDEPEGPEAVSEDVFFSLHPTLLWQPSLEASLMRHLGYPVAMSDRERTRFPQAYFERVIQHTFAGAMTVAEWATPNWGRGRILLD